MARTKNAMDAGLTPSQMGQFAGQEMAPMPTTSGSGKAVPMPTTSGGARTAPMPTTSGAGAVTDEERALLRGIQAVGRACGGSI
jgi:hypothetical protein